MKFSVWAFFIILIVMAVFIGSGAMSSNTVNLTLDMIDLYQKIDQQAKDIVRLQADVDVWKKAAEEAGAARDGANAQVVQQNTTIADFEKEIEALKQSNTILRLQNESLLVQNQDLEAENQDLNRKVKQLSLDKEVLQAEIEKLLGIARKKSCTLLDGVNALLAGNGQPGSPDQGWEGIVLLGSLFLGTAAGGAVYYQRRKTKVSVTMKRAELKEFIQYQRTIKRP